MAENDSSTRPISGSSPASPWYRRTSVVVILLALGVGTVLAIVLGVTLGGQSSASSPSSSIDSPSSSSSPGPAVVSPMEVPSSLLSVRPSNRPSSAPTDSSPSDSPSNHPTKPPQVPGAIVLGATSNNVPYYSCTTNDRDKGKQIVLLHGGAFSKETWLSYDMLDQFCSSARTVVALDLSTGANHQDLIQVLEALQADNIVTLPAITLVTPSASGYTIIDWMINGDILQLSNYISTWVPVATGSLTLASDAQVVSLLLDNATSSTMNSQVKVLAIHGNEDTAGGRYSNRLGALANATVVELVGRHAVYLQSPDDFVRTILDF